MIFFQKFYWQLVFTLRFGRQTKLHWVTLFCHLQMDSDLKENTHHEKGGRML